MYDTRRFPRRRDRRLPRRHDSRNAPRLSSRGVGVGFLSLLSVWGIPTSALSSGDPAKLPLDGCGSSHWNSGKGVDMSGPHDFLPEVWAILMRKLMVFSRRESARTGQTKNYRDRIEMTKKKRKKKEGGFIQPHFSMLPAFYRSQDFSWKSFDRSTADKRSPFY